MKRDYQRSAVYHAEDVAFDKSKPAEFETLNECKQFADTIIQSRHWQRHKGLKRYKLKDGRGRSHACARSKGVHNVSTPEIVLPKWSRSRWIIIHELAHILTDKTHPGAPAHGAFFAGHYLALVDELLGDNVEIMLRMSFDRGGVKYRLL